MQQGQLYIGLMSGTSMDAVDAVLLELQGSSTLIRGHLSLPIPDQLRASISRLSHPGDDHIDLLGATDQQLAFLFAETALSLMARHGLSASQVTAIGSHGQTIRHRPGNTGPGNRFTLQICDPSTLAALTGVTTVADFRRKDMALGGQGAPLVPAFHRHVFRHTSNNRAIVNIGGIANITFVPAHSSTEPVIGFDTGPGNCLMDGWIQRHQGKPFDANGAWAATGKSHPALLSQLLAEPYLATLPPKSTGKEIFNLVWLDQILSHHTAEIPAEDVQATLCCFTALSIAQGIAQLPPGSAVSELYLCGGGVHNAQLVSHLKEAMTNMSLQSTAALGLDPQHIEAAAFAWLAHQTLNHLPGSLASVTGAKRDAILGGIYFP